MKFTRSFFVFRVLWKNFRACDSFSLHFVVVSLSMPQIRGSCGHLKGSYDNHSSCLNCSGCFRSSCCSVCRSWPDLTWSLVEGRRRFSDRQMGRKKNAKVKERKDFASRNSSSSRPGLEQTVARDDPPGSTVTVMMMTLLRFCLSHHRGVSGYAGTPGFPAVEAHTEHRVLVRRDGGPIVPPRQIPFQ